MTYAAADAVAAAPAVAASELLGLSAGADNKVFPRLKIDELFACAPYRSADFVKHIFVAIDPNSGQYDTRPGGGSDFAVVSFYEHNGKTVIAGAEAIDANHPEDYLSPLAHHLTRLRASAATANATLVIAIELNLGQEAGWLSKYINERFNNVLIMQETALKVGVPTDAALKRDMANQLRSRLVRGAVHIAHDFVCVSSPAETVLGKLKQQMCDYAEVRTASTDPLRGARTQFSGKMGGRRDDLVVALQLAVIWSGVAKTDPKYAPCMGV